MVGRTLLGRLVELGYHIEVRQEWETGMERLTLFASAAGRETRVVRVDHAGEVAMEWAALQLAEACGAAGDENE